MHDKTVLITGCSSGIGRATAEAFLDQEWVVYATARNPADVETLGEAGCRIATLDVTDQSDIDRVVDRILEEEGRIDCLVNNAGFGQYGPLEEIPIDRLRRQFAVNVEGPHRLIRAVLPQMRRQREGTIVNVSSIMGRLSLPGTGAYSGSKFALEAMSDSLRVELRDHGIDVVVVEPGMVTTRFGERAREEVGSDADDDGGGESLGTEPTGAYEWFYSVFEDASVFGTEGPLAASADRVAADIVDAANATRPKSRYTPDPVARYGTLFRHLPDRWRDALVRLVRRVIT